MRYHLTLSGSIARCRSAGGLPQLGRRVVDGTARSVRPPDLVETAKLISQTLTIGAGQSDKYAPPVGITLGAIGQRVCGEYYSTILAELHTGKDPSRSDFWVMARPSAASSAARSCSKWTGKALHACRLTARVAGTLLSNAKATTAAAQAIATTIAREVGAQHAHNTAAAAAQNSHLTALGRLFATRRHAEIAAGRALASLFMKFGVSLHLNPAWYQRAESTLVAGLASGAVSPANRAYLRRFLHPGPLNILPTLGR